MRSSKVRQKSFIINEKIPEIDANGSNPVTMKERN